MLAGHASAPFRARAVCWSALLLALAGCGQPPGFELSWRIGDTLEDAPPLTSVKQCSDAGIFTIRVTIKLGEEVVSVDEYPCFSIVEAPPLEPGVYTVEVDGLRRNGETWPDSAHGSEVVTVVEGGEPPKVEVVLLAPPECDDGIDNDRDGTVDGQDPGCEIQTATAGPSESNDTELTVFQLDVAFLDRAVVKPYNVGVTGIRLEVPWPPIFDAPTNGQRPTQFERTVASHEIDLSQWHFPLPLLTSELEGNGTLELLATAVGADGDLTQTQSILFRIAEGEGSYVVGHLEFGAEQFLQPIIEPVALTFDPSCSPGGSLALERMWVRVLDENALALDAATLGLTGSTIVGGSATSILPVDEADGWISFECPSSAVRSNELAWGRYTIEAQARRADDVTCFESPATDLAPQPVSAQTIALDRVLVDDLPACPECSTDGDCLGQICDGGLCVEKEPG